jgi:hypothetical protein
MKRRNSRKTDMTEDKDFKALIRARMAKTGESYTAARHHLLRKAAPELDAQQPEDDQLPPETSFTLAPSR